MNTLAFAVILVVVIAATWFGYHLSYALASLVFDVRREGIRHLIMFLAVNALYTLTFGIWLCKQVIGMALTLLGG